MLVFNTGVGNFRSIHRTNLVTMNKKNNAWPDDVFR